MEDVIWYGVPEAVPVEIVPASMTPMGDLLVAHVDAAIELRIVPNLWPLHDVVLASGFDFSMVRMHNARPRTQP